MFIIFLFDISSYLIFESSFIKFELFSKLNQHTLKSFFNLFLKFFSFSRKSLQVFAEKNVLNDTTLILLFNTKTSISPNCS